MPLSALVAPETDPTPIFEAFRGSYGTQLLTAAVAHFQLFDHLVDGPLPFTDLRNKLELEQRPAIVLVTALRAMGLLEKNTDESIELTPLARGHLVSDAPFAVAGYIGLAAESPDVLEMVERLRSNRPAGAADNEAGAAFIYRDGLESAMEQEQSARQLTLSLAGRAKNVAPVLAARLSTEGTKHLLDLGGGTGIYSIALLHANSDLQVTVLDRPEVLKVAAEMAEQYGVADRLRLQSCDMFADKLPTDGDAILLSNILHDWDEPECRSLVKRCANALPNGGRLLIHDVFLNDQLDGPLPIALYSAALFTLTEGRAYSAAEFRSWIGDAGLVPGEITPTLVHCGVLPAHRP
jgi:predicted O-methyltransferase YrrM